MFSGCGSSTSSSGPWLESLSWAGAVSGSLTKASGTCRQRDTDVVYLHTANQLIELGIPRHSRGVVSQDPDKVAGGVTLYLGREGLYEGTSGSVTYGPGGNSGSMDVWLSQQWGNTMLPPSLHLTGRWTCR